MNTKRFNSMFAFRPLLLIFVIMLISILCGVLAYFGYFIPFTVMFSLLIIYLIGLLIKRRFVIAVIILVTILFSLFISILCVNYQNDYVDDGNYYISGRVSDLKSLDGEYNLILTNPKITLDGGMVNSNKNIKVKIYGSSSEINNGDNISFYGKLTSTTPFNKDNLKFLSNRNNVFYNSYASVDDITINNNSPNIFEVIKENTKKVFVSDKQNSTLQYAIMFGDTDGLDEELYTSFKNAGVVHVLAVSGLHVTFLAAIIFAILSLFKCSSKTKFIVVFIVLILFNFLIGFTPSVLRASVMCLVLLFAPICYRKYDILSALALVGIFNLIINPLYVFDAGFLLSYGCIFGISVVSPIIERLLGKIKVNKYLRMTLSITIGTTIATIPIMAIYFAEISLISAISNMLLLPLFSLAYFFSIFAMLMGFISISVGSFILIPSAFILKIIVSIVIFLGGLEFAIINVRKFSIIAGIIYILMLFCISDRCTANYKTKIITVISLFAIVLTTNIFINYRIPQNDQIFYSLNNDKSFVMSTSKGTSVLIGMGDGYYYNNKENISYIVQNNLNLKSIVLTEPLLSTDLFNELVLKHNIENIYLTPNISNTTLSEVLPDDIELHIVDTELNYFINDIKLNMMNVDEQNAIMLSVKNSSVCFAPNLTAGQVEYLLLNSPININYILANSSFDIKSNTTKSILSVFYNESNSESYSECFTLNILNDKISLYDNSVRVF